MGLFSLCGYFTSSVAETWMSIWLSLNSLVYNLISAVYQLFVVVANVNLFSEDIFDSITGRLYVVMGIAMLFIFAYNLILMIINPDDKKSTGQTTKVVKEVIISLVLIILLPTIFRYMSVFQYHVLNSGIIGKIIFGDSKSNVDCDYSDFGLLDDYIKVETQYVSIGGYCMKNAVGGAAGGLVIGSIVPAVGNAVGAGVGAAAGCIAGTLYSGIKNIAAFFGLTGDKASEVLEASCKLYYSLPEAERGARVVGPTIFSAFYSPTHFGYNECFQYLEECGDDKSCNYTFDEDNTDPNTDEDENGIIDTDEEKKICAFYVFDVDMAKYSGSIKVFNQDSEFISKIKDDKDIFEFNYFMAFVAGCLGLYMFICYTLSIGKRVAKLGFLQIISPITVMMRIVPKQKEAIFDKWLKDLINTYIDVFIRLLIIYFALFAVSLVPDVMSNLFATNGSGVLGGLASVIVILGILMFAQEAPELFKQYFGASGNFALKSPKKQISENKLAMGGVNAVRGGVYGATTGKGFKDRVGGFFSGAARGAVGGYDKAVKGIDTARTERENGSTWLGRAWDRARVGVGMETRAESQDRVTNRLSEQIKVNNEDEKRLKEIKNKSTDAITKETSKVKFTGFTYNGVDFSDMKYVQIKEYEEVLRSSYDNATDKAAKDKAYQELVNFQNKFSEEMKNKVGEGVTALINGDDFYGAFDDADYAMAKTNISQVIANEHKDENGNIVIRKITNSKELGDALDELGKDSREKSEEMSKTTRKPGYQARHADSRRVRGNGQSEKK